MALQELRPGLVTWAARLNKFLKLYGLKFPLADHVALVQLLYSLVTLPDLEPALVNQVLCSTVPCN